MIFCDHLLLGLVPVLKCGLNTQWDSIAETKFSFASSCQWEAASWLGVGYNVTSLLSSRTPCGLDLSAPCVPGSGFICVSALLYLEDAVCLVSPILSCSLSFSAVPWAPWGKGLMRTSCLDFFCFLFCTSYIGILSLWLLFLWSFLLEVLFGHFFFVCLLVLF